MQAGISEVGKGMNILCWRLGHKFIKERSSEHSLVSTICFRCGYNPKDGKYYD
jgi:hypothetical protein